MIKPDFNPSEAQLKQFGWIALFGFSMMALLVMSVFTGWTFNWAVYLLFGLAVLCPILSLTAPKAIKPIYVGMMGLALPIGLVLSAVVMRAIYYLLFTPMALWFKLRGRDTMERTLQPAADTYWKDHRDVTNPRTPASYFRLY